MTTQETQDKPMRELLSNTIDNLKFAVKEDHLTGKPIYAPDGTLILPVNKVSVGIVGGGGEYGQKKRAEIAEMPFAGASGGGISVTPLGYLICNGEGHKWYNVAVSSGEGKWADLIAATANLVKGGKKK